MGCFSSVGEEFVWRKPGRVRGAGVQCLSQKFERFFLRGRRARTDALASARARRFGLFDAEDLVAKCRDERDTRITGD